MYPTYSYVPVIELGSEAKISIISAEGMWLEQFYIYERPTFSVVSCMFHRRFSLTLEIEGNYNDPMDSVVFPNLPEEKCKVRSHAVSACAEHPELQNQKGMHT